jgi:hypothetical protein
MLRLLTGGTIGNNAAFFATLQQSSEPPITRPEQNRANRAETRLASERTLSVNGINLFLRGRLWSVDSCGTQILALAQGGFDSRREFGTKRVDEFERMRPI